MTEKQIKQFFPNEFHSGQGTWDKQTKLIVSIGYDLYHDDYEIADVLFAYHKISKLKWHEISRMANETGMSELVTLSRQSLVKWRKHKYDIYSMIIMGALAFKMGYKTAEELKAAGVVAKDKDGIKIKMLEDENARLKNEMVDVWARLKQTQEKAG
jgi:hypothetical protein